MSTFKLPPDPGSSTNYSLWRKDVVIWQKLTDVAEAKQGLTLQYACRSNQRIHEAVVNIETALVECEAGFKNVLAVLDALFKVDEKDAELQSYQDFETIRRKDNQTIADFINEFDAVLNKTKAHGNVISDNLLAVKLMRAANLTNSQQQLVKAATPEIDYKTVKSTMKRTFGASTRLESSIASPVQIDTPVVKTEPTYQTTHSDSHLSYTGASGGDRGHQIEDSDQFDEEILYGDYRNRGRYQSFSNQSNKMPESGFRQDLKWSGTGGGGGRNPNKGRNQLDRQGNITRCNICESINHWAAHCPDLHANDQQKKESVLYQVVLFQSDLDNPDTIAHLAHETLGAGVADCGASKTVCGREWLNSYIDLLSEEEQERVVYKPSSSVYKFGVGNLSKAVTSVLIPITLGSKKVTLEVDVISDDLPLLLSKPTLKRAHSHIDTENDEIVMLGETIKLINTKSGHYAVPLIPKVALIHKLTTETYQSIPTKVVLLSANPNVSRREIALKLHSQFAHPTAEKLIRLVNLSDLKEDTSLKEEINRISEACITCKRYKKAPPRPVVDLPLSSRFNEVVAMDIKFYHGTPVLHLIDTCTSYSSSAQLNSKEAKSVVESIFKQWIGIFGCPGKFISENGGEFVNEQFKSMAEALNIHVVTTTAESPWSNGLCERYNQVLGEMLDKIRDEVDCSISVALTWATSAKNSLQNVHGFSPSQLVFGFNPILPSVFNNMPPARSEGEYSEMISDNLNAMKKAREAFIQTESSERIRRALNHNTRTSSDTRYFTGDKVFYKRTADKRWHGPGVVIGQDGQFVLVRHQSTWIRVHPCHLQLIEDVNKAVPVSDKPSDGEDSEDEVTLNEGGDESEHIQTQEIIDQTTTSRPDADTADEERVISTSQKEHSEVQSDVRPQIRNPYNKAIKFRDILKPGVKVRFQHADSDEWYLGTLITRYGKVTGKTPNGWNVEVNGDVKYIDFDRDVGEVKEVLVTSEDIEDVESKEADSVGDELHVSQVFCALISSQVSEAKQKELEIWKTKQVYDEFNNKGYELIPTKCEVKPKLTDGVHSMKACLIAQRYEEISEFRRDPICSKPCIRVCLAITATSKWTFKSLAWYLRMYDELRRLVKKKLRRLVTACLSMFGKLSEVLRELKERVFVGFTSDHGN